MLSQCSKTDSHVKLQLALGNKNIMTVPTCVLAYVCKRAQNEHHVYVLQTVAPFTFALHYNKCKTAD